MLYMFLLPTIFLLVKMNEVALTVEALVTGSQTVPNWRLYRTNRLVRLAEKTI